MSQMRQTQIMGKTMTVMELSIILVEIANKYGDLPIGGGNMVDDRPLSKVHILNKHGHDISQSDDKTPVEVFFE